MGFNQEIQILEDRSDAARRVVLPGFTEVAICGLENISTFAEKFCGMILRLSKKTRP